jgi:hypothetical protein
MIGVREALESARFLAALPRFLRRPLTVSQARQALQRRFERRADDFLELAREVIFPRPSSPYRQLLLSAGCEYGDLERLVRREGLDPALGILARHGVYLTVDELKGRRPIVRGSTTIGTEPGGLRDPAATAHLAVHTGGSRSGGSPVSIDLAYVRDRAVDTFLAFVSAGGAAWDHAVWGVPGGSSVVVVLEVAAFGGRISRWFSQIDPRGAGLHPRYRWSPRVMRWGSAGAPTRIPTMEYAPLADPAAILRWIDEVRRAGRTPHLHTHCSSAVRLCHAAEDSGMRLDGVVLTAASEPTTAARLATIRRTGAACWPQYSSVETGVVGRGCLAAEAPDEVHVHDDRLALVQTDPAFVPAGLTTGALLITSLRRTASALTFLNVSMGDVGTLDRRSCGCPLEALGWKLHLRRVRSIEKLTAGGMTFLDTDVIRVLEEDLPARFGGGPTHYQLVEDEDADGEPGLRLLVHPAVGPLSPEAVAEAFLAAIGAGRGAGRVMSLAWRDARLLRVERRAPLATASGKILHLHAGGRGLEPPAANGAPRRPAGSPPSLPGRDAG